MNWKHVTTLLLKKILILKKMKLSNKLLIGFAAALILIPVLGMVVVSATQYKKGTYASYNYEVQLDNNQSFDAKSTSKFAVPFDQPFSRINIQEANGSSIEVHLNVDQKYGAKIPNELKDQIVFTVTNGVLNINFKKDFKAEEFRDRIMIIVYAPSFEGLKAAHLNNLHLTTKAENFEADVTDCNYFSINVGEVTTTQIVNGDTTSNEVNNQTVIKNLTLHLDKASFVLNKNLENLTITANNSSIIINDEDENNQSPIAIRNLDLKTLGTNDVKIRNVTVESAKGVFSDSTKLEIPAYVLNKMYQKK